MNKIVFQIKALKQLRKIPNNNLIHNKINDLADMPNFINVKALTGHEYQYRLRVGNYRVFLILMARFILFLLKR